VISFYHNDLLQIDKKIMGVAENQIPQLFDQIPLDVFGYLHLLDEEVYSNIKKFLPTMATKEVQLAWTGASDRTLLLQSLSFVKTVVNFYEKMAASDLQKAKFLDFGCGWGRLLRMFLKYIPESNIFGVDPMKQSLDQCAMHKVRGNLAQSDYLCRSLSFNDTKFDLVIAFSVFTHLSKRAMNDALCTIRSRVTDHAILAVTVRPANYWKVSKQYDHKDIDVEECIEKHNTEGFVFHPQNCAPIDGDITFGDTSISLNYIKENWHGWEVLATDVNLLDSSQIIVFLRPC
jgi:SAM-dependent methyltransferase